MATSELTLIATGSSGAIILPAYLSEIKAVVPGRITVVMTQTAQRFVSDEVVSWFADRVITPQDRSVNPVEIGVHATSIVVLPATGNTLATVAVGLMPTQATTILGAAARPCLFFPHMHEVVWGKPTMQRHVQTLREAGHVVVAPEPSVGYVISSKETRPYLSMPDPEDAARLIAEWVGSGADLDALAAHDALPQTA